MLDNFFLINFPQGAAGKFISSVLMASPSIAHYEPNIQYNKTPDQCLLYVKSSFTNNFKNWIATEPSHAKAWNLHFVSSKYPRGDNLTPDEFVHQCNLYGLDYFKNMINDGKYILFPWHKTTIPEFFENANKLTVLVDHKSYEWFDQSLWLKHHDVKDKQVVLLIHSWQQNQAMKKYFDKFQNPMHSEEPVDEFYQNHIVNNVDKKLFDVATKFDDRKNNICVNLSSILDTDLFLEFILALEGKFGLESIDKDFVVRAHQYWRQLHPY
jgi:hypothetical protein